MRIVDGLFIQGVELMLAGIGSVFVFLVLLVIVTRAMSWLCNLRASAPSTEVSKAHLAAISIAVERYRKERTASK